jgi:hypothetical protein
MNFGEILVICIIFIVITVFFNKIFLKHKHRKPHHKYSYIAPTQHSHKSGWTIAKHISKWVKARTLYAPDYNPKQGIHYFPYCKGRHFEYLYDGYENKIYKRKLHRH